MEVGAQLYQSLCGPGYILFRIGLGVWAIFQSRSVTSRHTFHPKSIFLSNHFSQLEKVVLQLLLYGRILYVSYTVDCKWFNKIDLVEIEVCQLIRDLLYL